MVVDTSALVAIMLMEPDRSLLEEKLSSANARTISAVSYMEAGMVLTTYFGEAGELKLDQMLFLADISVLPVTQTQAKLALAAFRQYGKGRHPASLNFGDCFSYALAKSSAQPLLFKGHDFPKTDIPIA